MSETGFINLELECPHCKHKFAYEFQFLIKKSDDVILDRILSNKCPNCGNASIMDMAFFYYDNSDANILYLVFPSEQINYFERIKKSADSMLSKYFEEISFSQQRIIRNAKRKFIEYTMFLSLLQGKGQDHLFMRNIRFTPTPSITFDDRFLLKGPLESLDLDKNDIAFDDKGISKIQKNIIFDTVQKLGLV